jgi:signal transduction histidine kinase
VGAKLRLSVADRGPGIPEAFRARIFERFAQAESAAPTKDGSGLGLAIARSIVVQHGGAISFETAEGRGTTFHVDLPLPLPETRGEAA